MSYLSPPDGNGRKGSSFRTDHFLPKQYSSRERSPYLMTDHLTGYRTESETDRACDVRSPTFASQAYNTSFSAVTSLTCLSSKHSPIAKRGQSSLATLPRRNQRPSLHGHSGGATHTNKRAGSCDLLTSGANSEQTRHVQSNSDVANKAASCDVLDSATLCSTPHSNEKIASDNAFENRRFGPKYSSTPSRFRLDSQSPIANSDDISKPIDSRLDSIQSSHTMESVFLPDSPVVKSLDILDTTDSSASKKPYGVVSDSADVVIIDKTRMCKQVIQVDYKTNIFLSHAQLKKLRKKGLLPEPNTETDKIVNQLLKESKSCVSSSHVAVGQSEHEERSVRGRLRNTFDKKAHTITNFLRRFRSPRSNNKDMEKRNRRSKSAGRLEGNRVFELESSQGCTGEISYEGPSTSSDQSTSAFHSSTPSEPMKSSDADSSQGLEVQSTANKPLQVQTPYTSAKPDASKRNISSTPSRRILKSLGDNSATDNKAVYRTFKEKQSPGYRRHAESSMMRAQALKVVDIPLQSANKAGNEVTLAGVPDKQLANRVAFDDTIGECSLDLDYTGSEPSISRCSERSDTADASKLSLSSRDQQIAPAQADITTTSPASIQNGELSTYEPKTPSYVKLSCALSGYKPYSSVQSNNSSLSPSPASQRAVHSSTCTPVNGQLGSGGGGEKVTLEYTPNSKSAYVKKVSEQFEQITTHSSHNHSATDNKSALNDSDVTACGGSVNNNTVEAKVCGADDNSEADSYLPLSQNCFIKNDRKANHLAFASSGSITDCHKVARLDDSPTSTTHPSHNPAQQHHLDNNVQDNHAFLQSNCSHSAADETAIADDSHASRDESNSDSVRPARLALSSRHSSDVTDGALTSPLTSPTAQQRTVITNSINTDLPVEYDVPHLATVTTSSNTVKTAAAEVEEVQCNGEVLNGVTPTSVPSAIASYNSCDSLDSTSTSKDGDHFTRVMSVEADQIIVRCTTAEKDLPNSSMSEEVSGKVRAAIGKANLLTTKKFKQFKGLCERNMTQQADESFQTTCQDLAGFWDMVLLQVHDVHLLFDEVDKLRQNDWKAASNKCSPVLSKSVPARGGGKRSARTNTPKSAKAAEAARARDQARRKLLEAKKAGRRQRQTSETDSFEVEIIA